VGKKGEIRINSPGLDVIVLSARKEEDEELEIELRKLSSSLFDQEEDNKIKLPQHIFWTARGNKLVVARHECGEMGNIPAAVHTASLIARYNPSVMIFAGIAGSLDGTKAAIGDVVIPQIVKSLSYNKLKEIADNDYRALSSAKKAEALYEGFCQLRRNTGQIPITPDAQSCLSRFNFREESKNLESIRYPSSWNEFGVDTGRRPLILTDEESFSWDKVLSSKRFIADVVHAYVPSASIVDMESYGFLRAVASMQKTYTTNGIVVRAVSDYAFAKELTDGDLQWRNLAKRNMAITVRRLIETAIPEMLGI
jgi:nucleoside phosphorylase